MKNIWLTIILAALTIPVQQLSAKVRWLQTVHDFGAFKEDDGKVRCQFLFVNEGDEEVSIRAARASCGCTAPSFTKTPVAKGDTGTVTVTFNPTGRPGRFTKTVSMDIAGAGAGPRQILTIKGVVIGSSNTLRSRYPIESGPMKLRTTQIPFGSVSKGKAKSAFLEVYNASDTPLRPRWENVPPYIRIASADHDTIAPGEQTVYSLVLTPEATALYGIITDSAYIAVDGQQPLKIDITAILEEDFSRLTPSQRQNAPVIRLPETRVDFDNLVAGSTDPVTRSFEIANTGKSDLLLRRVYTIDPGVTVSSSPDKIKKGKTGIIHVTVDPSMLPGEILNARVQIICNDPDNPISIVRVVGELH